MEISTAVQNEQVKLLATAVNNIGVAMIVTGVIAPTVGYLVGSLYVDHPLRLLSVISIYAVIGVFLLLRARGILKGLVL